MWLLVFFVTPIVEMYLLIEVAGYINTLPTVALVMLTAVIGVFLLKRQGVATLTRGLSRMEGGEMPAQEMAEGLLLAIAGALLVTPGFVTDTVGFTLLFPPSRVAIARAMLRRVQVQTFGTTGFQAGPGGPGPFSEPGPRPQGAGPRPQGERGDRVTIEGDFERRS